MLAKIVILALVGLSVAYQYENSFKDYKNGFEGEYKKGYESNYPGYYPGYKGYDAGYSYGNEGYSYKNGFEYGYGYQNAYQAAFYKYRQNVTEFEFSSWMPNHEYVYNVTSKTLTALPELADQYTGIFTRAQLVCRPKSRDYVVCFVRFPEYAVFNEVLPYGYATSFYQASFKFRAMPMSSKPFGIRYHKGAIKGLYVEKTIPNNEVNILKAWISQLQIDTRGANLMHSSKPVHPSKSEWNGHYKVMEPLVTGECETHYDVNLIPAYMVQSHKQWFPLGYLRGEDGQFIQISKTQNFDRCDQRMGYHFGFTGYSDFKPNTNQMGNVASKSSTSMVHITGNWYNFTIQSSSTVNKVAIAPSLVNQNAALVVAQVNMTLFDVKPYTKVPMGPAEDLKVFVDLVYSYNMPSDKKNNVRPGNETDSSSSSSSSSSSESSSSSSESQENPKISPVEQYKAQLDQVEKRGNRYRRDLNAYKEKKYYEAYKLDQYRLSRKNDTSSDSSSSDDSSSSSSSSESLEYNNGTSPDSSSSSSSSSDSSSSSSSSSSESDSLSSEEFYYQPIPYNYSYAPEAPFLPYFTGYKGYNIFYARNVDAKRSAAKLCEEMATDMQNPSTLPKANTMSKFNILTRAIRAMNYHDLFELVQKYYVSPKERQVAEISDKKFSKRVDCWYILRDAVAEAGTPCAFRLIREFVLQKKLRGFEAATVVATLARSLRYPTEQIMHDFFLMVTNHTVLNQEYLNVTALFTYTDFVNQAHVSNRSAYNYYPVFSFGRLADADYKIIEHKIVPWFAHQLREAVYYQDSVKAQVYIRCLGNLGHPQILSVFEPYLEGKIPITNFQRLAMIVAMDKLVIYYPKLAGSVLYRVYQNAADAYEIRCAAVYLLMRTDPPVDMLQRMAESTHHESSMYVRSAVKTAIESAASAGQYDDFSNLAANARAAVQFLNPEDVSIQYSVNHIYDYAMDNLELSFRLHYGEIASDDHRVPKGAFYHMRSNFGGMKKLSTYYYLTSSMEAFFDIFGKQFNTMYFADYFKSADFSSNFYNFDRYAKFYKQYYYNKDDAYFQKYYGEKKGYYSDKEPAMFTAPRIAKLLNIDAEEAEQLEGQMMYKLFNCHFFSAFDNKTLESIPHKMRHMFEDLEDGYGFDLTKFYQQQDVVLAWPLATGFPFIYTLTAPTVFKFEVDASAKTHPQVYKQPAGHPEKENDFYFHVPKTLNASVDASILFSRMVDAKVGFVTPFDHQRYIAGYQKKLQAYLPLNFEMAFDFAANEYEIEMKFLDAKEDHLLFHMSSWPYTGFKDITDMRPIAESPNAKIVHDEDQTTKNFAYTFGQDMTGIALHATARYDCDSFFDVEHFWNLFHKHDFVSAFSYPFAYQPYEYHQFNLYYDAQRSHAKSFKFFSYQKFGAPSFEETGPHHPANRHSYSGNYYESNYAQPFVYSAGSQRRYEQFFRNAASGIRNSFVRYYDFGFEFYAPQYKSEFVFTTAFADSPVDKTSRQLYYFYASPMFPSQSYFKDIPFNGKQFQFCATATSEFPRVPYLKFSDFDKYYGDATQYFDFLYGESCQGGAHISVKGKQKQTGKYREYLRFSDVAKACKEQMADGYYQFEECQQAIDQAYYYDFYDYSFEYKDVGVVAKNLTNYFYNYFQYAFYPYFESNFFYHGKPNQFKAEFEFAPYGNYYNASFFAPSYAFAVKNYPIENDYSTYFPYFFKYTFFPRYQPYFLHRLPSHKPRSRNFYELSKYEQFAFYDRKPQYPSCSFSKDYFYTFDNNKYFYDMGDCWHTVLYTVKPDYDFYAQESHFYNSDFEYKYKNGFEEYEQFAALARRGDDNQLYFKFVFGDNVIDIFPTNGDVPFVKFNGRPYDISKYNIAHFEYKEGYPSFPFFYAFAYPNKDLEVSFFGGKLKFATDGYRARFFSDYSYYNNFVGLCGTNNGEYFDEFVTPDQCYMRKPEYFAASYALTGMNCTGPAKAFYYAYQQKAKEECVKQEYYYGDIIYNQENYHPRYRYYNHNVEESSSSSSSSSSDSSSSSSSESKSVSSASSEEPKEYAAHKQDHTMKECPVQHQHQFFEQGDKICFTLRPLPVCHSKCVATDKISKYFDVHCFEKDSAKAKQYKSEIFRGYAPDFKSYSAHKTYKFNYPKSCVYKAY